MSQNKIDLLIVVSKLVANAKIHSPGPLHICFWDNQLTCDWVGHTLERHPIFLQLTMEQYLKGLSPAEWSHLHRILLNFYEQRS